jgi:hypothetical protein
VGWCLPLNPDVSLNHRILFFEWSTWNLFHTIYMAGKYISVTV